jgi:uncharacterized oligopeptide transporter (OPT) family protein
MTTPRRRGLIAGTITAASLISVLAVTIWAVIAASIGSVPAQLEGIYVVTLTVAGAAFVITGPNGGLDYWYRRLGGSESGGGA